MDEALKESLKQFLSSLIAATDKACDAAIDATKQDGRFRNAAVNWSDFGCRSAEFYMNEFGSFGYRAYVEEADPYNLELQAFIGEELAKSGFPEVQVLTEW